ncbi:MAG: mechanosensitive ion channel family protein [Flavobacterium sp.]
MEDVNAFFTHLTNVVITYIPNVIAAVVTLIIGILVIKLFRRFIKSLMTKREMDPTALRFVMDVVTWTLRLLLLVAVIGKLGVPVTGFAAVLGAVGLAVGLSLQGSLSNFAGGLLIVLFKPFRVGDYIEAQNQAGVVNSIQIFSTRIITSNNQVIYMPNGALSNGTIKNFSQEPIRRAEIILNVGYGSDLKQVKEVIMQVINADDRVLHDPEPAIEIKTLGESGIDVAAMFWAERPDYAAMVSDFYENIKAAFDKAGVELPFPKRDIYVKLEGESRYNTQST